MSSFDSYIEGPAVHQKGMEAFPEEISETDALLDDGFALTFTLLSKWQNMPGNIPHHKNVTPTEIGSAILPFLFILDVVLEDNQEPDFKWRLFGTAISQRYGIEATGHLLSKAMKLDASIAESLRLARLVYSLKQPRFMRTRFVKDGRQYHQARTVILPLSGDNGNVERLFGCTAWSR